MSEGIGSEIQKEMEREGKKNKCKPLRINSLISLWERIKKKRISTSDPLSLTLISLVPPVSYSNMFSLYSSYRNTFTNSANVMNTQGQLCWTLSSLLLPSCFPLPIFKYHMVVCHRFFVIDFLTWSDWYAFRDGTSSFNSNILIHHI